MYTYIPLSWASLPRFRFPDLANRKCPFSGWSLWSVSSIFPEFMCLFHIGSEELQGPMAPPHSRPTECVMARTRLTLILPNSPGLHCRRHCEGLVNVVSKDSCYKSEVWVVGSFNNFIHSLKPQNFLNRAKDLRQNRLIQCGCFAILSPVLQISGKCILPSSFKWCLSLA